MEVALAVAVGMLCILCFIVGAKVGQTVHRGEKVELPTVSPTKAYREHREKKEAEQEQTRIDTILRNVEAYDGTGRGQEDVPGR